MNDEKKALTVLIYFAFCQPVPNSDLPSMLPVLPSAIPLRHLSWAQLFLCSFGFWILYLCCYLPITQLVVPFMNSAIPLLMPILPSAILLCCLSWAQLFPCCSQSWTYLLLCCRLSWAQLLLYCCLSWAHCLLITQLFLWCRVFWVQIFLLCCLFWAQLFLFADYPELSQSTAATCPALSFFSVLPVLSTKPLAFSAHNSGYCSGAACSELHCSSVLPIPKLAMPLLMPILSSAILLCSLSWVQLLHYCCQSWTYLFVCCFLS